MSNSESGRKLNQAVNTTSKAVGGALSQAKGAFSNFWSAMTTTLPATVQTVSEPNDDSHRINNISTGNGDLDHSFEILNVTPVEHSSTGSLMDAQNADKLPPVNAQSLDTQDSATKPIASVSAPAGVVEIGHEAATVLDTERITTSKIFTV